MPVSNDELKTIIKNLDMRNQLNPNGDLEERKRLEAEFHDKKHMELATAQQDKAMDTFEAVYTNRKYYRAVSACFQHTENWMHTELKDKVYLDYCCGIGGNAIKAAQAGAKLVIGIDISDYSLRRAEERAQEAGVADRCIFFKGDAENTGLPDASIDRIICSGVLHHLDVTHAFPELERILAPGGKILAIEALDYNPAIKMYRMRTPQIRTEWEKAHILSMKDVRLARQYFNVPRPKFWHILGIIGPHVPAILQPVLNGVDRVLEKIPGIQLMAWMFTFELRKNKSLPKV